MGALLSSVEEVLLAKGRQEILEFFELMNDAEDPMISAKVGRCLALKIASLSKMSSVEQLLSELVTEDTKDEDTKAPSTPIAEVKEMVMNKSPAKEPKPKEARR